MSRNANDWTHRINPRNSPQDLEDIRHAAKELEQESRRLPRHTGVVFQNVSQYVILASVLATASLAFYHLWKELSRDAHRDGDRGGARSSHR